MRVLPYAIAVMQCSAGGVYLWNREWRLALIWFGVSLANFALAGAK